MTPQTRTTRALPGIGVLAVALGLSWIGVGLTERASRNLEDVAEVTGDRAPVGSTAIDVDHVIAEPADHVSKSPTPDPPPESMASPGGSERLVPDDPAEGSIANVVRVRVVVQLHEAPGDVGLPHPELLRVTPRGHYEAIGPPAAGVHPALELSRRMAAGKPLRDVDRSERTFELPEPGLYVPAWSVWRCVPDTQTWRPVRGLGDAIEIDPRDGERDVILSVTLRPADLMLDSSIDARTPGATYHVTEKDG